MPDHEFDDETKALAAMSMPVCDAVRLFLRRVVADHALPIELKVPTPKPLLRWTPVDHRSGRYVSCNALRALRHSLGCR